MPTGKKIVIFVRPGLDSFLKDIINELSGSNEIEKVLIGENKDLKLMDKWMEWADICWFEWCDALILYGSALPMAKDKKIVCRLHSYEVFTNLPFQVNWSNVDKLILVSKPIKKFVKDKFGLCEDKVRVIPNGVSTDDFSFKQRKPGFKIAHVGYINHKKGPMLLLHTFKAIHDADGRYTLHIAGAYQDSRYSLYFQQMTKHMGLENSFFFEGWQENLDQWLDDKSYILCTSVLEGQNLSVMQAMAKGIKPVVHNFVGASEIYGEKYIWNTINEAVAMVSEKAYNSIEYKNYIENSYSTDKQSKAVNKLLDEIITSNEEKHNFNYTLYWNQRLNSKFNIEGVGYMGLGVIYNKFLYKNRLDILDGVLARLFEDIRTKRVLELGPGTGVFTGYFHSKGVLEYYGIDVAEKSVNELGSMYDTYHFRHGDIKDECNFEGAYDLVLASDVLLHIISEENYKKTVKNISCHLKETGYCIFFDPVSIINTKSISPHAVIRDKEYIKKILDGNGLKLAKILPVSYFMNNPFDRKAAGGKGMCILEAFRVVSHLFSNNFISDNEKLILGEYLLYREKKLLNKYNQGLSEKLLIVQNKNNKQEFGFEIRDLLDKESILEKISSLEKLLLDKNIKRHKHFNTLKELLDHMENNF